MAEKPETRFTRRLLVELRKLPGTYWHKVEAGTKRTTVDIVGCAGGLYVAIEVKVWPNVLNPTGMQSYTLKSVAAAGGIACVVTDRPRPLCPVPELTIDDAVEFIWQSVVEANATAAASNARRKKLVK